MEKMQGLSCGQRQKYWCELTPDEKCEQLRDQIKSAESRIVAMLQQLVPLMSHEHSACGKIVVPLTGAQNPSGSYAKADKE